MKKTPTSMEERISLLKENYEKRLQALQDNFTKIAKQIDSDQLITTMKNDSTSKSFVGHRVKEIIEEGVIQEKEKQIQQLISELSYAQSELKQLKDANIQLTTERIQRTEALEKKIDEIQTKLEKERKQRESIVNERDKLKRDLTQLSINIDQSAKQADAKVEQERNKICKDYDAIKEELENVKLRSQNSDSLIKSIKAEYEDKVRETEEIVIQNNKLQTCITEISNEKDMIYNELIKTQDQMKDLQMLSQEASQRIITLSDEKKKLEETVKKLDTEKSSIVDKFNAYGEQLQRSHGDSIEELSKKHQNKMEKMKEKIMSLTSDLSIKSQDIEKAKNITNDMKITYEKAITQLHGDLAKVRSEWEKKCKELEIEGQKTLAEEQARNTFQINHLQEEYQKAMETKLKEVQADAQQQILKTKQEGNEIKMMLDSKISQIDKSYIPMGRHEATIEETSKKLKDKFRQEMETMKEEFEKTMSIRLSTVDTQRKKEQEILKASYESNLQAMQRSIDDQKQSYSNLYSKYQLLVKEKDMVEQKVANNTSDHNNYKIISEAQREKDARILQEEKEKCITLEAELKSMQEIVSELQQKYIASQQSLSNLNSSQIIINRADNDETFNKLKAEQIKVKSLSKQVEELKIALCEYEKDKKVITENYKKKVMESDNEISTLQSNMASMRKKDNMELQKEIQSHSDTNAKVLELESKCISLQNKLKEATANYEESSKANEALQVTVTEMKTAMYSIEQQVAQNKNDIYEQTQLTARYKRKLASVQKTAKNILIRNITGFKEYIIQLTSDVKRVLTALKKDSVTVIEVIANQYKERTSNISTKITQSISIEKEKIKSELINQVKQREHDLLSRSAMDTSKLDEVIKNKNKELQEYQRQLTEEQKHNNAIIKENSDLKANQRLKNEECLTLVNENEQLKENLKKANNKVNSIQNKYNEEFMQHKADVEGSQSLQEQYKSRLNDLHSIQKQVNDLRVNSINEYRALLSDIQLNQSHHKQEIDQTLQECGKTISQYGANLNKEKEKAEHYKNKVNEIQEEISTSHLEWQQEKSTIESKIKSTNALVIQESEKCKRIQMNSEEEIEKLKDQNKEYTHKIDICNTTMAKYKGEIAKLESMIKEYKKKEATIEDSFKTKIDELNYMINRRDKENEELRAILSKSYQTLNSSVDKIKQASRMNTETEELTKKIKEGQFNMRKKESPSDYSGDEVQKKSPLSMSQLKSTPGKILKK